MTADRAYVTNSYLISNGDGWLLSFKQCYHRDNLQTSTHPIMIVPGYGMNAFIFGYHPTGLSMEEYFAQQGFEVWSVNLRAQEPSRNLCGTHRYGLADLALTDLPLLVEAILERTHTTAKKVDAIGCSLGASIICIYLACAATPHVRAFVSMGGPLRWDSVNILVKMAFSQPWLLKMIPLKGTRPVLRTIAPLLLKAIPRFFEIYLHTNITDTSKMDILTNTVENPNRFVNAEIARWIKAGDLNINGSNVTTSLKQVKTPFLNVIANADGIVPESVAMSISDAIGSEHRDVLRVGNDTLKFAHADLFISRLSHEMVFAPMAHWLNKINHA